MILSGQVSPDGKLFAFTNTGYTHHALHIVDLATEKEIATFQMEQAWSGLAFSPDGDRIYVSNGAGYRGSDIQVLRSLGQRTVGRRRASATRCTARRRIRRRSSWLGTSPDGALLYALNNSDQQLYILETRGGRAVARLRGRRPSDVGAPLEGWQDALCREPWDPRTSRSSTSSEPSQSSDRRDARDRSASERRRADAGRPTVRLVRQHEQRHRVRPEVAAAARGHQHGARSEGSGRQHAELARAVAGWQAALRRERRQQLGVA